LATPAGFPIGKCLNLIFPLFSDNLTFYFLSDASKTLPHIRSRPAEAESVGSFASERGEFFKKAHARNSSSGNLSNFSMV